MQDLSKIDFSKCKLPELRGHQAFAYLEPTGVTVAWSLHSIPQHGDCYDIVTRGRGKPWRTIAQSLTRDDFDRLWSMTDIVDAFIESELATSKLKEEFPMSADDASEFLKTHSGEHHLAWKRVAKHGFGLGSGQHWHRWNAASGKIEAMVSGWATDENFGDHRYRLIESRNVPFTPKWRPCSKEFALANPGQSQARYNAGCNAYDIWLEWKPVCEFHLTCTGDVYEFRTTAPENQPPIDTRNPGRAYSAKGATTTEPTLTDLAAQVQRLRRRVRKLEKQGEK